MHKVLWLMLAGFLMTGTAGAQVAPAPSDPGRSTPPTWVRKPSSKEFDAVFPVEARRQGIDGRVTLACTLSTRGAFDRCTVVEETPERLGFGAAAIRLAPKFKMKPPTRDGKPVAGQTIRFPVAFEAG